MAKNVCWMLTLLTFVMFCLSFSYLILVPVEPKFVESQFDTPAPAEDASRFLGRIASARVRLRPRARVCVARS